MRHACMPAMWLPALAFLLAIDGPARAQVIVFVADGAGDFRCCSTSLRQTVMEHALPFEVETFVWSHGHYRSLADQIGITHAREQGSRLAEQIIARKTACPAATLCLVGHSAGSAVVLAAAESLPPGTIHRLVLLAPSVRADYDTRTALAATCAGIDAFCSRLDRRHTAIVFLLERIKSGGFCIPAAHCGFRCTARSNQRELRNHLWKPSWKCIGHNGGHGGCYSPEFLRAVVMPLLVGK